jgi:hypothetical protein
MRIPFLGKLIDERFLDRRRRSSTVAMMAGALTAWALLMWRWLHHSWSWELFAVLAVMAVVKLALMTYYTITD